MGYDLVLLSALISAISVLLMMCLLTCLRCGRRRQTSVARGACTPSSTIYTVPANYNAITVPPSSAQWSPTHRRIASVSDRFAVPLDLLPANFDFSAPGVEHKGEYVLVKDLSLIQKPTQDEFQTQSPYNPNFL